MVRCRSVTRCGRIPAHEVEQGRRCGKTTRPPAFGRRAATHAKARA
jgi:hypothetical protein